MKTYLECIPCFFRHGIESAKVLGADETVRKQVVDEISKAIPSFPMTSSPPEMGKIVHDIISKILNTSDPYRNLKEESNRLALGVYKKLTQKIENSKDRLLESLEISIAGNIIDYGANHGVRVEQEILRILDKENKIKQKRHFHYPSFKETLAKASMVLFIGDNAGEIVFDRVLAEEIKRLYPAKKIV